MLAASLTLVASPALGKRVPNDGVTSQKIKDRQVKKRDLARGAVTRRSIVPRAVDGTNVLDRALHGVDIDRNSLQGSEIDEASLDFNVLQARLSGGCSSGEAIRSVSALGQPTCVDVTGGGLGGDLGGPLGGDLTGSLPNPSIANDAVNTAKLAADAVTAAKVPLNELGGSDILESSLSGASITGVDAATVDGANASDFLGAATTAGGDLGGTFSNLQIGTGSVGTSEVDSSLTAADIADTSTLGGPEINEGNLSGASITGVDAATVDGVNATDFLGATAAASGDLAGNFPNPTIGPNAVGTSEVDSSLTAADIADTNTLGSAEINESNLTVIQGTGQVRRATASPTSSSGATVLNLPGLGDLVVDTCTPNATAILQAATLGFDNSTDGDPVLFWAESNGISLPSSLLTGALGAGVQDLGSDLVGELNGNELVTVYLYRPSDNTSASVRIAEDARSADCRFFVEATTSS